MISPIAFVTRNSRIEESYSLTLPLRPHSLVDMSIYLSEKLQPALPAYRRQHSILGKIINQIQRINNPQYITLGTNELRGIMQLINAQTLEPDTLDQTGLLPIDEVSRLLEQLNQRMGVKTVTTALPVQATNRRRLSRLAGFFSESARLLQSVRARIA